jgi:hypothetical protein
VDQNKQDTQARKVRRSQCVESEVQKAFFARSEFDSGDSLVLRIAKLALDDVIMALDMQPESSTRERQGKLKEDEIARKAYLEARQRMAGFAEGNALEFQSLIVRLVEGLVHSGSAIIFLRLRDADRERGEMVVVDLESGLPAREPDQS